MNQQVGIFGLNISRTSPEKWAKLWKTRNQIVLFSSPLQQFGIFAWNQGIKRALKITRDFPALLLMPVFSNWAFGSLEKKSLVDCKSNPKLGVSFTSTIINTIITLIGLISCQIWIHSSGTVMKNFFDSKSNFRNDVRVNHMFSRILNFLFVIFLWGYNFF